MTPANQLGQELLRTDLFRWISEADLAMLANCFDMEEETLAADTLRAIGNRLGYLLFGQAELSTGEKIGAGFLFGTGASGEAEGGAVHTLTPCHILWMDWDIMTSVCYRACWFHGRFVSEVRARLSAQSIAARMDHSAAKGGWGRV